MNKILKSLLSSFVLFSPIVSLSGCNSAQQEINYTKWMSYLPDTEQLSNISIPFSHDSACWRQNLTPGDGDPLLNFIKDDFVCQSSDISQQLSVGIRGFDFRPYLDIDKPTHYIGNAHSSGSLPLPSPFDIEVYYQSILNYENLFSSLINYLDNNKSEFIILRSTLERNVSQADCPEYINLIKNIIDKYKSYFYIGADDSTTVSKLRGKIVLFSYWMGGKGRMEGNDPSGNPWQNPFLSIGGVPSVGQTDDDLFKGHALYTSPYEDVIKFLKDQNTIPGFSFCETNRGFFSGGVDEVYNTPRDWAEIDEPPIADFIKHDGNLKKVGLVALDFASERYGIDLTQSIVRVNTLIR